ncbi:MAG: GNAT family N-acetyltransferase [Bacilli bacterium]|nr:GNAT family N-acetyltransferase [Bacilli bacterium]
MCYNADKVYSFHLTEVEIKQYPYFNFEEEQESLAYVNIYMLDYDLLKTEDYYTQFEKKYTDKGYSFKDSFIRAYYDYYNLDEYSCNPGPVYYFYQIANMSNIDIKPGFKIASIDFIKSNIKNKGYGTILLSKVEDFLKKSCFKTIVIQLLNNDEKLINFYKKAGLSI